MESLSKTLLHVLNTSLRRWASLRLVRLVVGLNTVYAMLEGGWCAFAPHPGRGVWLGVESLRPSVRELARHADENTVAAAAALTAVAAASAAWVYSTPGSIRPARNPFSMLSEIVSLDEGLKKMARGRGNCIGISIDAHLAGLEVKASCRLLVGPTLHPTIAKSLGYDGLLGVHVRPELCSRVEHLVSQGARFSDIIKRVRGLVLYLDMYVSAGVG